jgi:superfamily II DNA or RNA helicase
MNGKITPREYQTEAVAIVLKKWRSGVTRQLVSLPTGTGKTVVFGLLAKEHSFLHTVCLARQ